VGTNAGLAYIDADVPCPHLEELRWRRPESHAYLQAV
jgi:hypothetical protein